MITEKTLRKWRAEALRERNLLMFPDPTILTTTREVETQERILRLTQELLDHHLMRKA